MNFEFLILDLEKNIKLGAHNQIPEGAARVVHWHRQKYCV